MASIRMARRLGLYVSPSPSKPWKLLPFLGRLVHSFHGLEGEGDTYRPNLLAILILAIPDELSQNINLLNKVQVRSYTVSPIHTTITRCRACLGRHRLCTRRRHIRPCCFTGPGMRASSIFVLVKMRRADCSLFTLFTIW